MDLVILAGGKGKRIKKLNPIKPKPLIKIENKIFLDLIINYYSKFNFENIFILAGYKGFLIKKAFQNKIKNFTNIKCIIEKSPKDTGGALFQLKNKIEKDFILINGDTFLNIGNPKILKNIIQKKDIGSLCLIKNKRKNKVKFNNLNLNNDNDVIITKNSNYINSGIYYFNKKIFKYIPNKKISLEREIIPKLISLKKIKGKFINCSFLDIGTPRDLIFAKKNLPLMLKKPAVFLDRDGVINHDKGYTHNFKNFKFRKNVISALKYLQKKNFLIFIVTNQAGIAKKKYSLLQFFKLHKKINSYLSEKDIFIDDLEYCPHHPDGLIKSLSIKCKCRKPSNLMITRLINRWFINLTKSFFIGDKISDELAAKKSNIKFYYVENDISKQVKNIIKK
tara:strand:- start:4565 stop:5743 length:1179 start_codon:yes stop_codon:yes gene_type:complete